MFGGAIQTVVGGGGGGGGPTVPQPALLTSLYGASLVDTDSMDAGGTAFNTTTGVFTFDLNTAGIGNDGFREGPIHWAIPVSGVGGIHPTIDFDAGDELVVLVASPTWPASSGANLGVGLALVNEGVIGGATVGIGHTWYRTTTHRSGVQTETLGTFSDTLLTGSETHFEVSWRRWPKGAASTLEMLRNATADNGTNHTVMSYRSAANFGTGDAWLAVQGISIGTPGSASSMTFKLYTYIKPGPGQDLSSYT